MNKRTEQTRWTPKRLLSLLMALIMTLSLLPTAAFAADSSAAGNSADNPVTIDYTQKTYGYATAATSPITTQISEEGLTSYTVTFKPQIQFVDSSNNETANTFSYQSDIPFKPGVSISTNANEEKTIGQYTYTVQQVNADGTGAPNTTIVTNNIRGTSKIPVTSSLSCGGSDFSAKALENNMIRLKYTVYEGDSASGTPLGEVYVGITGIQVTGIEYTITYRPGADAAWATPSTGLSETSESGVYATTVTPGEDGKASYTIDSAASVKKDGYTFVGWRVGANGSTGSVMKAGDTIGGITGDVNLYAELEKNHTITFQSEYSGASGLMASATSNGTKYIVPVEPTMYGFTFAGWKVTRGNADVTGNEITNITGDITLTALWTEDGTTPVGSHKVTFDGVYTGVSNIPAVQVVKDGEMTTAPTQTPLREGYVFKHWSATQNGEAYAFGSVLTEDLTLYAVWEREKVNITWPTGLTGVSSTSPSPLPASVDKGSSISFQLKLDNGYEFRQGAVKVDGVPLGWTFDEATNTYHFTFKADTDAENKTIVVTAENPTVKTFTISLPQGDGYAATFTGCKDAAGAAITAAEGMTSYTFSYGDKFKIKLESDADVAATLRVNGAVATTTNGKDTLTATTDEYTVEGNYLVSASAKRRVERTVIFTLLPEYGQYTQMFVDNGSKITAPTAPDIAGYNFGGKWYKDANCETEWNFDTDTVTSNTVLYGKLTAKPYTISYNANKPNTATGEVQGMPTSDTTKTHGIAVSLDTATPTLTGYTFKGWATSANGPVAYAAGGQYLVDSDITLYAVWQIDTFTVTVSSGAGYSTVPSGTYTVEYGKPFTVTINVDRQYAAVKPTVKDNGTPVEVTGNPNDIGAASYTYTIDSVTEGHTIDITVTQNEVHTVSFTVSKLTSAPNATILTAEAEAAPFLTQSVEHGYYASMPAAPEREGFKFKGYYSDATGMTAFPFEQPITNNKEVFAVYEPILPVITVTDALNGTGWKTENWKHGTETMTNADTTNKSFTIAYGDNVTFDLVIAKGYDYSKLSVTANGLALGYQSATTDEKTGVTTLHYYLGSVMADTRIAITGIERKTVTIIYNDNGGYGGPVQETVNYFLPGDVHNGEISKTVPKREGYDFLGWATTNKADAPAYSNPAKTTAPVTTNVADFTSDTVLYAVWQAKETGITLEVSNTIDDTATPKAQYEGENVTLTATITSGTASVTTGSVQFYRCTDADPTAPAATWTLLNSAVVSGGTAIYTAKTSDFVYGGTNKDTYKAVFIPTEGNGYTKIETTTNPTVKVMSTAISWKLDTTAAPAIGTNANVLTITDKNGTTVTAMVAGQVYTLELPAIYALDEQNTPLTVNKDYSVTWQYRNDKGVWTDYTNSGSGDTTKVDAAYSQYVFRAVVTPVTGATSHFTKAAKYTTVGALEKDQYETALISEPTTEVDLQKTATVLEITGADDEGSVTIAGTSVTTGLAQFEGQKVTLTATVTDDNTTKGVTTGHVDFYRKGATTDTLLNASPIAVGANGVATCEVTISNWDTTKGVTENKDEFYAVYLANATYDTSNSKTTPQTVYIKSTAIKTPIIDSTLANEAGDTATTYNDNLTGLLAGVQHEFKLRQTGAEATTGDWSVVALDGRTVAAKNYDIEWQYKTNGNFAKADNDSTAVTYTTTTTKVDDRYRVKLTGKGVFAGSEVTSKDAVIGTKQNVTVTVEATDAITKTPVDRENRKYPDVYQLNEITLTATVAAANDKPTMQPTGTVTFYYKDGDNWVKLDSAMLAEDTNHSMTASITTNKLPVTDTTNTWRNVEITAVYEGNDTFNASGNYDATNSTVSAGTTANGVTDDTVTVYSSVVFNCNDENKKQPTDGDKGIHISVSDGAFKTNEKATLALSDIYTLDRELTDETLRNTIAKLDPDTDYTVRWQKLNGATAIGDAEGTDFANSKRWTDIGATGTTLVLDKVEQNTAYRAVITVANPATPIVKGSFEKIDQGIVGEKDANDGRQVYYSNVLMPTDTSMTVSVALNTSKIGAENTEGITEGETVTANVFLSGVVGAVPNANVTVTVTNDSAKGNDTAYEKTFTSMNTVNGWNAFSWNTAEIDDNGVPTAPGFYTLTVSATTNTGYAAKEITRSLIVRESSYTIVPENTTVTYNGRTQGLEVALNGFGFNGTGINDAANKSWTVRYEDANGNPVEPTQAGTYKAKITLPASAYWTEQSIETTFTIAPRSVSIADAIAQAKVYDGTTNVNIVEVMLNDAVTDQTTNSTGLPTNNVGIINGDSIYAVATEAKLSSANAGDNSFTISTIDLRGDDAANYVWNGTAYTEDIYVSRSQVYGEHGTLELKQGETFPADKVIKMIDQSGREITLGTGTEDYTLTFYYHSDTKIEKTTDISKLGLYTVVARPNQSNYKSGVTMQFTVVETATNLTEAATPKPSTLIYLSDTATKYNPAGNVPVTAKNAQGNTVKVEYHGTTWSETVPSYAGRYLVKATDTSTGDVAYGIYTITKAHPSIDVTPATDLTYNSKPQNGYTGTPTVPTSAESYFTYAGDVAIGYNVQKEGNVDEQAPVDAGTYTVTLHVNETANYTAHEISKSFTIAKKALTIKADSWQTTQYDAFPDMTAGYTGLAAETGDTTPDTSLRDVQIAPEFLYNPTGGKSNYSNDSLDQVGGVAIQPIDALSKNYAITYENGQYTKQRTETNVDLDIHGLPQSSTGTNTVYYGDVIQLYPYGYYTTHANGSGIFDWSVTTAADFKGTVTIGKETGLLNVNGVGEFTVTLKRGVGEQQIKTEINVTAIQKEAKIALKNVDKVYTGASQTYDYTGNVTVHDELYHPIGNFVDSKLTRTSTDRIDVGTQVTTAKVTSAWAYQSETYGGKFTINDKDATVAPGAQSTVYGTLEAFDTNPKYKVDGKAGSVDPVTGVNVASQTDAYNRLDVHDGYEILVAGTEDMNYNVKYTTDETAEDSAVTTYGGMKLYSTTTKAKELMTAELNDATVYGEQANDLDWILDAVKSTTRDGETYADNLADFDLADTTGIFIKQDKDDCVGNAKTYKAANREEGNTSNTALAADRTATEKAADGNYELVFSSVTNAKAANYTLANAEVKNAEGTMTAPTGTVGFIGAAATSDNLIEGSANIAQRPIKLEQAVTDAQLYWRLPQSQLYTALVNILKAEENSVGRGLAKGHTIEDLDLSFTIKVGSTTYNVAKDGTDAINFAATGNATVTATVGDTNYKLEGGQYQFDIVLKNIQIEATYTTKTFTGFTVLIKVHNENGTITPLNDAKGLSYKIFKKTGNTIDKTTAYASGTLTYQNRTAYDDKGGLCGVFTATYPQLPLLNSGETYFIQMYEYGVELKTNS